MQRAVVQIVVRDEADVVIAAGAVVRDPVDGGMGGAGQALEPTKGRQRYAHGLAVSTPGTVEPVARSQHVVHGSPGYRPLPRCVLASPRRASHRPAYSYP